MDCLVVWWNWRKLLINEVSINQRMICTGLCRQAFGTMHILLPWIIAKLAVQGVSNREFGPLY